MKKYLYTVAALSCAFLLSPVFASANEPGAVVNAMVTAKNNAVAQTSVTNTGLSATVNVGARVTYDLNGDSVVNAEDMAIVLGAWGSCESTTSNTTCSGDLNGDGQVNQTDIEIIKRNWSNKPGVKTTSNKSADLNKDGSVGGADLSLLLGAWGKCADTTCAADLNGDALVGKADQAILLAAWNSTNKPTFTKMEHARMRAGVNFRTAAGISTSNTSASADETRERTARREVVKGVLSNVRQQLTNGIEVVTTFANRIDSRIEKLNAEGIDTATSAKFVATAKVEIEAARTAFASLPSTLVEANMSTESLAKVRATISDVKSHLEAARKNLVDAISNLKPGQNKTTNTAI